MTLSRDETRALSFIGLLIALAVLARAADRPAPIEAGGGAVDLAALEAASRERLGRPDGPEPLRPGEKVDPNTASEAQLARLPRGRSLAARIAADRGANGPYRSVRDLDRVPGIGPATLAAWKDLLALPWEPPAGVDAAAGPGGGLAAAAAGAGSAAGPGAGSPPAVPPVDPNRASAAELERVPGIGPALAARIIAWRTANGPFRSLDELVRVRGIGPATLARIRPHLSLGA